MKTLKVILHLVGILLSVGLIWPVIFETSDWGINWLNAHGPLNRWGLVALGLVSAVIAGAIIGSFKALVTPKATETHAGETNWNPAWGWALFAAIANLAFIFLLE